MGATLAHEPRARQSVTTIPTQEALIDAIVVRSFSKSYGSHDAVTGVDLEVRAGDVYGFLGRNGAGKTTTIRAALGMIGATSGTIDVLGQRVGRGRGPWRRVGYLVESAAAYPELSVRENLEVARLLHLVSDRRAVDRVINLLGLAEEADRRASSLSTGNLQRLALARALLGDPELLVLDEPLNALDPAGVMEVRSLLVSLARDQGVTVFMSSHLLTEVDRIATRIAIIHRGRIVQELDAAELDRQRKRWLVVDASDRPAARGALVRAGYDVDAAADGRLIVTSRAAVEDPGAISRMLVAEDTPPTALSVEEEDLESYFIRVTG